MAPLDWMTFYWINMSWADRKNASTYLSSLTMFVARTVVAAIFSLSMLSVHAKKVWLLFVTLWKKDFNSCMQCGDNFSHFGNSCVCLSPFQLCNDKCGSWKSCHSGIPHHDHQPDHNNHKRGADQQLMDGQLCPSGETICGGLSGEGSYECIDTKSTLDSC